jgi:hypothetical protein
VFQSLPSKLVSGLQMVFSPLETWSNCYSFSCESARLNIGLVSKWSAVSFKIRAVFLTFEIQTRAQCYQHLRT